MSRISVLDVTLRDGGCVNNFNFGNTYIGKILDAQEKSGVEYIELGYIDNKAGSETERTQYINEKVIRQNVIKTKKEGIKYVAMMDYGKYNPEDLEERRPDGIDGIRVAFHKKNMRDIVAVGKTIMSKGYEFFIQPMITLRYSDQELIDLIKMVNEELPDASGFYIVDSFGEMRANDMERVLNLVDHNLMDDMLLGFHSHNNLQLSYSNAIEMIQFRTNRNIMLDCSIMGMGKGAGNLNTELLLEHLNLYYGKNYNTFPLLEVIDSVINQLHSEFYWGYAVEYYLSSVNGCTPSYASHFYNKHMLPVDQVGELLGLIDEQKKVSFDKEYAEELYRKYNERKEVIDTDAVAEIKAKLAGKKVLLVAPGKSIAKEKDIVDKYNADEDTVTICLNNFVYDSEYVLTTRTESYDEAVANAKNTIVTSNISKGGRGNVLVLNYKDWIVVDETTHDSSGVVALNLLKVCDVNDIYLAGFDGFSTNINENYYDSNFRHPVSEESAERRNRFFKNFVDEIRKTKNVEFITSTKYE